MPNLLPFYLCPPPPKGLYLPPAQWLWGDAPVMSRGAWHRCQHGAHRWLFMTFCCKNTPRGAFACWNQTGMYPSTVELGCLGGGVPCPHPQGGHAAAERRMLLARAEPCNDFLSARAILGGGVFPTRRGFPTWGGCTSMSWVPGTS